jgi:transposase-like protein
MQAASFRKWLERVAQLTRRQREQLFALLRPAVGLDLVCATIEQVRPVSSCPHCGARRLHRHGLDRGVQRYRCCACGKTFSALTGTPLARLRHRGKWLDYLEGMLDGKSVRKAADEVGVHRNTAFRWRHRFLHLAKDDRPEALAASPKRTSCSCSSPRKARASWIARRASVVAWPAGAASTANTSACWSPEIAPGIPSIS